MRKRAPVMRAALDRRIGVHDRHQFELKLEYLAPSDEPRSRYVVEAYLCIPGSLNVSRETASLDDLYADIHNYVRLKTPELSWPELMALPDSPLARLQALFTAPAPDPAQVTYESKLYACVFRAALRDFVEAAEVDLARGGSGAVRRVAESAEAALGGMAAVSGAFRALRPRAEALTVPERARFAYRLADEFTSITVEQLLRRIIVALATVSSPPPAADALRQRLFEAILAEEQHRRSQGYPTIVDPRSDNEPYVYRSGLLKKYCQSVLFLPVRRQAARRRWQEVFFAISAGIAMAFATAAAFWAQMRWGSLGLRVFLILVLAYMFKDRIKEGTRGIFARVLEKRLYDRKIVIDDPAGGVLGVLQEKIMYLPSVGALPEDAREIRRRGVDAEMRMAEEDLVESIIHYRKEIVLAADKLTSRRGGGGVTDIMRFQVSRLLRDMDEPDQEIDYIDINARTMEPVKAAKTYHVDVVFRFTSRPGQSPQTTLMRLILDRNGIRRIERVDAAGGSSAVVPPEA
jgi:hypothetical protein